MDVGSETASSARTDLQFKTWHLATALFLVAFLLRTAGVNWGLPDSTHHWSYHPDEPVIWMYSRQIVPWEGKVTPGFYNYGTFYLSLLRVFGDVFGGGGDMASSHLVGRLLNCVAGAAMASLVFTLLKGKTSDFGALAGGLAVAFAPGLVVHSRFQTVDVMATALLLAGLVFVTAPKSDHKISPWMAGVFFGLSAGTKYTGLLGLVAAAVVFVPHKMWKDLSKVVATTFVTFFVTTPGALLDSGKFWKDFSYEVTHSSQGHGLVFAGTPPGFVYHLFNLSIGFGTLLTILGLAGLGALAWKKHSWAYGLVAFALVEYALIGRAEVKFMRYAFPLIPVLAIGFGWLVGELHGHSNKRYRLGIVVALLGLLGVPDGGLRTSILSSSFMCSPALDPRHTVLSFVPAGSTVGLVSDPWFYTANFYPEAGSPRWVPYEKRQELMKASKYHLVQHIPLNPDERFDWDVRTLDQKPNYVVFSSFETEGLQRIASDPPAQFKLQADRYNEFVARLTKDYALLSDEPNSWAFVHDMMYIHPTVWVWKRKAP